MLCYAMQFQRTGLIPNPKASFSARIRYMILYCMRYHIRIVSQRGMYLLIWPTNCPLLASSYSTRRRFHPRRYRSRLIIPPSNPLLPRYLLPRTIFHLALLNGLIIVPRLLIRGLPLPHFHVVSRLALLQWLVAPSLLGSVDGDETAVRTRHVGDHSAGDFGRFGCDGARLSAGYGLPAVVGVAAGGDEEGEVEESWMLWVSICWGQCGNQE